MAKNNLPLYDRAGVGVLCYKSRSDLDVMVSTGEAIRVCSRCGDSPEAKRCDRKKQPHAETIHVATSLYRNTRSSSAAISTAEMMANVGHARTFKPLPSFGVKKEAQRKVRAWPHVADDLAPLVRCRTAPDRHQERRAMVVALRMYDHLKLRGLLSDTFVVLLHVFRVERLLLKEFGLESPALGGAQREQLTVLFQAAMDAVRSGRTLQVMIDDASYLDRLKPSFDFHSVWQAAVRFKTGGGTR